MNRKSLIGTILVIIGIIGVIYVIMSDGKSPLEGIKSVFTQEFEYEKSIDISEVHSINLETGFTRVNIVEGSGPQAIIRLEGRSKDNTSIDQYVEIKQKDEQLTIETKESSAFNFGINLTRIEMTLELPDKEWNSIQVHTGSGNIQFTNHNAEQLSLKAGSGRIDVEDVIAGKLNLKTSSGNIHADRLQSTQIAGKSSSGNIELEDISSKSLDLDTSSGNITIDEFNAERFVFHSSSGQVRLYNGTADFKGSTSSGNIKLEAEDLLYHADFKSGSGNISITLEDDPQSLAVQFNGGSGKARIHKNGFNYKTDSNHSDDLNGAFGSGELLLKVKTGSGNFTLK